MTDTPIAFRTRYFVLTPVDEAAYSKLLVEAFPRMRFFDEPPSAYEGPTPPEITLHESLSACARHYVLAIFEPDWAPCWSNRSKSGWWSIRNLPYPDVVIERGGQIFPWQPKASLKSVEGPEPQRIQGGRIYFRCHKGDKAELAIAGKALRLLGKVATNKRQMRVRYPSLEVVGYDEKNSHLWMGHDAIRWLRENPERMADFNAFLKIGYRPMDD